MEKITAGQTGAFAHVYLRSFSFYKNFVRYQVGTYLESVSYRAGAARLQSQTRGSYSLVGFGPQLWY